MLSGETAYGKYPLEAVRFMAKTARKVADWVISHSDYLDASQLVVSDTVLDSAPFRFAFVKSPRWKQFINEFNDELARMKADGRFQAILDRYVPSDLL